MKEASLVQDKYKKVNYERQMYVDAVLSSKSRKIVIVAGPGTGKTFLFKEVLQGKKNSLTLTFINALVVKPKESGGRISTLDKWSF